MKSRNELLLVAPIVGFNQSSSIDIVMEEPINHLSFFFNTLQANGTLFELISSKAVRITRDVTSTNRSISKILGRLVNGRFRLIIIDNEPKFQEYQLRNEQTLNDGRPHRIELDLNRNQLIIDGIHTESLTKINHQINPNQLHFLPDRSLAGWLQDIRVNDQRISLTNNNTSYIQPLTNNPCYPINPCENHGICLVTNAYEYL